MFSKVFIIALASSPLVSAHGKIAAIQGDAGGNTTGIGIQGGVVPGAGSNSKTEVDTTVFNSIKAQSNGLGKTTGQGKNTIDMVSQAQDLSGGGDLPQVSASNGSLSGVYHIVTTDGAGPVKAVLDTTGTGNFADGTLMDVTSQVPGTFGEISPSGKSVLRRALVAMGVISKRAANVNKDYPVAVAVPAGTTCTGTVNGQSNVCLAKIANSNPAGPFGGVVAFQIAGASGTTDSTATAAAAGAASTASAVSAKANKAGGKKAVKFAA